MKISIFTETRRKSASGTYGIYLRITEDNGNRFLVATGLKTHSPLQDTTFPSSEPHAQIKSRSLLQKVTDCKNFNLLHSEIKGEELKKSLSQIVSGTYVTYSHRLFISFFDDYLAHRSDELNPATIKLYTESKNIVSEFDSKATLETITPEWLHRLFEYRKKKGRKVNGINRTMRDIRAVFNWCRAKRYTDNYPFADYTIPHEQTRHRNLNVQVLRKFLGYPIPEYQVRYRDVFLLSLYLWGINIGDLLEMKKEDYYDDYIHYDRNKTGKPYCIKVEPEAKAIIEKYKGQEHLLCFLDTIEDYHSFLKQMNKALKSIGKTYQDGKKTTGEALLPYLSSMYARHTIATLAAEIGTPMSTISMGLGHSMTGGALVTQVYVEFQQWLIDDCMRDVIDYLNSDLTAKQFITKKRVQESGMADLLNNLNAMIGNRV